jgi:hypothetical protein
MLCSLKTFKRKIWEEKMRKDTKLYKILRYIYLNGHRKVTSNEIADKTGIPRKQMTPYTNRLLWYVNKEKIDGLYHFWIKPHSLEYIKKMLKNAT